jgi:hypothetical protein
MPKSANFYAVLFFFFDKNATFYSIFTFSTKIPQNSILYKNTLYN